MRIYDPRVGRFLSLDPISSNYPFYTPYQFGGNKPVSSIDLDGAEDWMANQQFLLQQRVTYLQVTQAKSNGTISPYNPNDRTFAQKWRDSKNIFVKMTYDAANGLYTLPQQLTSGVTGQEYIENIGGNVHEARGIGGEKQRMNNFVNAASVLVPSAEGAQGIKGLSLLDDALRLGANLEDDVLKAGAKIEFQSLAELGLKDGMEVASSKALELGEKFLGKGYTEPVAGSGRYVSKDGKRVFRMGTSDITGAHGGGPHVNFETLVPNPDKPGKMKVDKNFHIYLKD